jgi:hypothetical protein
MTSTRYGCRTCRKEVIAQNGRLICCGKNEPVPTPRKLHGAIPTFGTGEVIYNEGRIAFLDDGNGNVYVDGDDFLGDGWGLD